MAALPFSWRPAKGGRVRIAHHGRVVTVLRGEAAARFRRQVEGADAAAEQQLLARVTGNFKRGNERGGKG